MRELHGPAGPIDAWVNGQPVYSDGTLGEPIEQPEVPAGVRAPGGGASGAVIPPGEPIQLRPRPTSVHSVDDLDRYLATRLEALAHDCQPDAIEAIGLSAHNRSLGAYSALTELRGLIAAWRSEEAEEQAADAESDRWKEAYGPDADKLAAYQAEGR